MRAMRLTLHGPCTHAAIHALLRLRGVPLQGCGFIIISGGGPFASAACHARPADTHAPTAAPLRHRIGTRSQQRRAPPCCQAPEQHPLKGLQRSLSSRRACRGALQPRQLLSYRNRCGTTHQCGSSVKRFAFPSNRPPRAPGHCRVDTRITFTSSSAQPSVTGLTIRR